MKLEDLTIADLKAILDEAQSMSIQVQENGRLGDFEYWFDLVNRTEEVLHLKIKQLI